MNLFTENYIKESTVDGYSDMLPQLVPYYTFEEYCKLTLNPKNLTPIEYIFQYEFAMTDLDDEGNLIESDVDVQEELNTLYETKECQDLIDMGWDPKISPTKENMDVARERNLNWLYENHICNMISAFNDSPVFLNEITDREVARNSNLAPIFIVQQFEPSPAGVVIKGFGKVTGKGWKYSHSGIALNSSLGTVYTFLLKGMSSESIVKYASRDNDIRVQALFITPKARNMIKKQLDYYLQNQDKTKYSFAGLAKLVFHMGKQKKFSTQMFCSEFVDAILKGANIDVSGKASENVAPEDLGLYTDNINIYQVFEGKAKDYDKDKVDAQIEKLKQTVKYEQLNAVKTKRERTELKNEKDEAAAKKKEEFDNSKKGKVINTAKAAGKAVIGAPKKGVKALMNKYSEYQKSAEYDEPTAEELRKQLATESAED